MGLYLTPLVYIYHLFFKGGRVQSQNSFWRGNIGVNTTYNPNHLEDLTDGYLHSGIAPRREIFSFYIFILPWSLSLITYLIIYHGHFYTYFCLHFTPLWFVFPEGESVRIPATSYLVALFSLVYEFFFTLLLPYNLDVPCYSPNRQRYCSAWPERVWTLYKSPV